MIVKTSLISQKVAKAKKQQGTLAKGTVDAMVMSAAGLSLNILQDMNEPVFEMKFESLPPTSKVGYRSVLLEIFMIPLILQTSPLNLLPFVSAMRIS